MTDVVGELVQRLWPNREVKLEPLLGGITNANFLVDLGDERVVLRIPGDNTELLGISRLHETSANHLASSLGIAPEVLRSSETEGWMVTRFLPGRAIPADELGGEPMLAALASTLRRLHSAGTIGVSFNPFAVVREYHEIARARGVEEPFDYPAAVSVLDRIEAVRTFRPTSFCHNDLLNGNFIYDGEIRILDWEYAGMGDPFFDLANFSSNHQLPRESNTRLLTHYFGRRDPSLLAVLELMKLVSELRETMWGVVQLAISALEVDFAGYCEEHSGRYEALVGAMDLDEALHAAAALTDPETDSGRGLG
ncbi:MAG TPA: phosphotransferase [Acidimicrobiales bacterium]|nr:phosphotransferase [Acidimicrobiales bacterium]